MRGYVSVINDLTINEENRLRQKVQKLSEERDALITEMDQKMKDEINQLRTELGLI
jgi:hypothetical protein